MPAKVEKGTCTACGACAEICPVNAIKINDTAAVDADSCVDCGQCVEECPVKAISLQ